MSDQTEQYITPTALCAERNWSRSKLFLLGTPDKTFRIVGSGGKSGSLFAMSRVIAIEQEHKPFKSEKRKTASLFVAQTKYTEMMRWVQNLEIKFSVAPTITLSGLAKQAIWNRNQAMPEWKNDTEAEYASGCEGDQHIQRWMVNYLRHACTEYDAQLYARFGKVGVQEAHELLKNKINTAAKAFIRGLVRV
jgi:hypothetical protein